MAKGTKAKPTSGKSPKKAKGTKAKAKPSKRKPNQAKALPSRSRVKGNTVSRRSERVTAMNKKRAPSNPSSKNSRSSKKNSRSSKSSTSSSPSPVPTKRTKLSGQDKNDLLLDLNQDPNAHKDDFEKDLKQIVETEKMKLELQSGGTKVGRCKGFFTQDRYNLTVEYLTLKKELLTIEDGSDQAMKIKSTLAKKFKGKTMDQFRLGGEDWKKLYRLKKSVRTTQLGGIHSIKLSSLDMDKFDEVIAIDDGKTFDRINDIHWCSTNPLNHIGSQQLLNKVQDTYGFNIPNNISQLVIKHCPVCKVANKSRNKMYSCGPLIFTAIDLTFCASKQKVKCQNHYHPYLLICLFTKKQYFDLIPLQTNDNAEVLFNLFHLFNAFGYPSSVRYFEHDDAPVQFVLDKLNGSLTVTVDEFEKGLLEWIQCSQSSRDHVGVSPLTSTRRRSEVLDKIVEFLLIFINKFLQEETLSHSSFQGWMPLIQSFLNEDQCYTSRKKTTFLASFSDADELYNEWEDAMKKRFEVTPARKSVEEQRQEKKNNDLEEVSNGEDNDLDGDEQDLEGEESSDNDIENVKSVVDFTIYKSSGSSSEDGSSSEEEEGLDLDSDIQKEATLSFTPKRRNGTRLMLKKTKQKLDLIAKKGSTYEDRKLNAFNNVENEPAPVETTCVQKDIVDKVPEYTGIVESPTEDAETVTSERSKSTNDTSSHSKEIDIGLAQDSGTEGSVRECYNTVSNESSNAQLIVTEVLLDSEKNVNESSAESTGTSATHTEIPHTELNTEEEHSEKSGRQSNELVKDVSITVSKESNVMKAVKDAVSNTSNGSNEEEKEVSSPVSKEQKITKVIKDAVINTYEGSNEGGKEVSTSVSKKTKNTTAPNLNIIGNMFSKQKDMNEGRCLVKVSDNVSKLVPIKKDLKK